MEGIKFYWLLWIVWIWVTFIMRKENVYRFKTASFSLGLIIAASIKVSLFIYEVNATAFVLMSIFLLETKGKSSSFILSIFLSSFIVMLGYSSFLLFELFDPIWVFIDRKFLLIIGSVFLVSLLQKGIYERCMVMGIGLLEGEFIFATVLKKYDFPYLISSLGFLEIITMGVIAIIVWSKIPLLLAFISKTGYQKMKGRNMNLHE